MEGERMYDAKCNIHGRLPDWFIILKISVATESDKLIIHAMNSIKEDNPNFIFHNWLLARFLRMLNQQYLR
jgi:hypothetical protein